jgi:prephenate dehydrogenase
MTTIRQRLGKHVPEVTLSTVGGHPLLGNGSLETSQQQRIIVHNNMRSVGGVTYSVLPHVINGDK